MLVILALVLYFCMFDYVIFLQIRRHTKKFSSKIPKIYQGAPNYNSSSTYLIGPFLRRSLDLFSVCEVIRAGVKGLHLDSRAMKESGIWRRKWDMA